MYSIARYDKVASVACKLVRRLEVTSYEMGEWKIEGQRVRMRGRSRRERGPRDDARETLLCLQTKYAAYAFVRFVNAT